MVDASTRNLISRLIEELDTSPPAELIPRAIDRMSASGLVAPTVWLADYGYETLTDASGRLSPRVIAESIEGRALTEASAVDDGVRTHFPLARRGQAIGVLSLTAPQSARSQVEALAVVLCSALLASGGHSDVLPIARGARHLRLAATVQHELLPLPSYADSVLEIGGQIEPAYDIAGDAFDYAVNRESIHVGVFDAVGHGLRATLLAMTVVGAYRRERRTDVSLAEIAVGVDEAVAEVLRSGEFVTGVLIRYDPATSLLEWWNAGHLPPFVTRDSRTEILDHEPTRVPFGLGTSGEPTVATTRPGDLVVLYSDGVVQARSAEHVMIGPSFLAELTAGTSRDVSLPAMCRQVLHRVVDHVQGPLTDDATIVAMRLGE